MSGQQEFLDGLQDLIRIGKTKGDVLTKEDIRSCFCDMEIDDAKMGLIASFMAENQIRIAGVIPEIVEETQVEEEIVSKEEPSAVLDLYMEEMKEISNFDKEKEIKLLKELEEGNLEVVNDLLEMNLEMVAKLADEYRGKGIQTADLIQEGNLALFCAISEYDKQEHGIFDSFIKKQARKAMETALEENAITTRSARKMAQQINKMNDLATAMAKELGREAKPEELAEKMNLSVEQIKDLMKTSLDAINLLDQ